VTFKVLLATQEDEPALVELLRLRHAEEGHGIFDEDRARSVVTRGIARDLAIVGIIRGRNSIEASVGLFVTEPWDSKIQILSDLWLTVLEPYRKSDRAKCLVDFSKWAATELDKPLMLTLALNPQTERKDKFYARHLPRSGSMFLYQPGKEAA
jgi:hypothetical protein